MRFRDHRTDPGALVQRIAEGHLARNIEQTLHQGITDTFLDQEPAAGNAALSGIVIDAIGYAIGCRLKIRIGKDDLRALAAEFQADALDAARCDLAKLGADANRAGESHHVGARIFRQHLAGWIAVTGDDVEDAIWNAGLAGQLRHADRRAGGEFGRLQNDRAAGPDRPRHALGGDDEGEVPGRDDADDAHGFAQHEAKTIIADIVVCLAFQSPRLPGSIGPEIGAEADLAARLGDRLADLEASTRASSS
jgi:hypothetical protein